MVKHRAWAVQKKVMLVSGIVFAAASAISIMGLLQQVKFEPLTWYAGLFFVFALTSYVGRCGDKTKKAIGFLSGFSFLIYVTHEYIMTVITKLVYPNLPAKTWCILLPYLFIPIVLMSLLVSGGWVLKKLLPKVYDFLFNSR
jgi:hypothetical protein